MYYVYFHTNLINQKKYCGVTNDTTRRWRNNGIEYKPHSYENPNRHFWNAIQKYGWHNFKSEIVFTTPNSKEAFEKEKELIKKYDLTNRKNGYNTSKGGNGGIIYEVHPRGMLGKKHSEETKRQMSLSSEGKNNPFFGRDWEEFGGHPRGMLGKRHSEETKKQISSKLKGKTFSEERNRKISESLSNKPKSEEVKRKISETKKKNASQKGFRANCSKWVKIEYPNGKIELYGSIEKCLKHLKISRIIYGKLVNTNKQFNPKYGKTAERLSHVIGIKISTIDDTEITNDLKKSIVL